MPMLTYLYIGVNRLTGTLPPLPPQLQSLITGANQLTGTLPSQWPSQLVSAQLGVNRHNGSLPAALASLPHLQMLMLTENMLTGQIPEGWSAPGAFPELFSLQCRENLLSGLLPDSWGSQSAFQLLQILDLSGNDLSGVLPDSWGSQGAFPALQSLTLEDTAVAGVIPESWTSEDGFPQLQALSLDYTYLNGSVPSFHNPQLEFLSLGGCAFTSDLHALWNSTAPLSVISIANNPLSGTLPDLPLALTTLSFLDASNNSLQGTVPLSWLRAGSFLSHVSYLNVGKTWVKSLSEESWRQQLCLNQEFYSPDVTGLQIAQLPSVLRSLLAQQLGDQRGKNVFTDDVSFKQRFSQSENANYFASFLQHGHNQLIAVPSICANSGAGKVLLILWVLFGACCLLIFGVYVYMSRNSSKPTFSLCTGCLPVLPVLFVQLLTSLVQQVFSGLGGLAFYWYDFITSIIVLTQVWGTWPGHALAAIFFCHLAIVGFIVSFQAVFRLIAWKYDCSQHTLSLDAMVIVFSVFCGPILIPVVILLDTIAFTRHVILLIHHMVRVPGLRWLDPWYVAIFKMQHCVSSQNLLGLSWVDLENYESMHNLIAAAVQSLPTVILNSIVFSLGNKPSHGIFLSNNLFVAAIIASCLAMLKCLVVVLFQAYQMKLHPIRLVIIQVSGKTIAAEKPQGLQFQVSSSIDSLVQRYEATGSAPLGAPGRIVMAGP